MKKSYQLSQVKESKSGPLKQIFMTLFFMSAILVGVEYSKSGNKDLVGDMATEEVMPQAEQSSGRRPASVSNEIQIVQIEQPGQPLDMKGLEDIQDREAFMVDAQKDQMDESQMQKAVAGLAEQLGWDLELRKKENGSYAISNKVVERDFQDQPLDAFDEPTWANMETHLIDVINQKTEHLTAEDHKALESWRGE